MGIETVLIPLSDIPSAPPPPPLVFKATTQFLRKESIPFLKSKELRKKKKKKTKEKIFNFHFRITNKEYLETLAYQRKWDKPRDRITYFYLSNLP